MAKAIKGKLSDQKPYRSHGRVQRLFGVYIPPKKIPVAKKYLTLRFVITGIIPSKKNDYYSENNYRHIMNEAFTRPNPKMWLKANIKSWIRGSKKYLSWLDEVDVSIREQQAFWAAKYNLIYPLNFVSIKTYYYFADNTARDLISKDEAVYDMLVKKGLIVDDDYSILHKTESNGGNYKDDIPKSICTVDVTLALF